MLLSFSRGKNVKKILLSALFLLIFQPIAHAQELTREWLAQNVGLPHEETDAQTGRVLQTGKSAPQRTVSPQKVAAPRAVKTTVRQGRVSRGFAGGVQRNNPATARTVQKSVAQKRPVADNARKGKSSANGLSGADDDTAKIEAYLARRPDLLPDVPEKRD